MYKQLIEIEASNVAKIQIFDERIRCAFVDGAKYTCQKLVDWIDNCNHPMASPSDVDSMKGWTVKDIKDFCKQMLDEPSSKD